MEKSKALLRYHAFRKEIIEYLGGHCVICNSTYMLEIDHIDWRLKEYDISKIWYKEDLTWKEVEKCQLLCYEHHKEKTKQDLKEKMTKDRSKLHGTLSQYYRYKCRCDLCKECYSIWKRELRIKNGETANIRGPYSKDPEHGTTARYHRKCRCDLCRAANTQKARENREKKKRR